MSLKIIESTKKSLKEFFSSKFNIALVLILLLIGSFAYFQGTGESVEYSGSGLKEVHFFYTPTCPYCSQQKPIYEEIKKERSDVEFFDHDASTQAGSSLFYSLANEAGLDTSRMGVKQKINMAWKPVLRILRFLL